MAIYPKLFKFLTTSLFLLTIFLFLYQLNATHLTSWDEAWYAVVARNMARTGDFVTPIYNGQVWFSGAPFYIWLLALWFQLTNYSIAGVRLLSALFGIGTVALTYAIGTKLKNRSTGLIAAFILTTTIQFLFRTRQGNLDAAIAFFNAASVYSFLFIKSDSRWSYVLGIFVGLGFLTKNILGLFPLVFVLFIPRKDSLKLLTSFLLITIPWHAAATLTHGARFINDYFLQYAFTKLTNSNPVSGTNIFWYTGVLKHGLKFWSPVLPASLLWGVYRLIISIRQKTLTRQLFIPLGWTILPLLILTLARMRNDWYIIGFYPGISLLIALFLTQISDFLALRFPKSLAPILFSLFIVGVGLVNIYRYRHSFIVPDTTAAEASLAQIANQLTDPSEPIMLDDNYLPVALFYSDRNAFPLRYSRAYESLVGPETLKTATESGARLVLTNTQTIDQLIDALHQPQFETIATRDDKLLIKINYD